MARTRTAAKRGDRTGHERISSVAENYLLCLYHIKEQGNRPTLTRLADQLRHIPLTEGLGTTLPTVAGMLRRMAREQMLTMNPKKEIELTPRGVELAEAMVRRHRLAERLVVDLLGLDLYLSDVEAHRLEHAISQELEGKIAERLGNPTTCPLGRPIPGSGYKPPPGRSLTLDRASPGVAYRVEHIPEEDQNLLKFLIERGVLPQQEVRIVETAQFRGLLVFATAVGETALGYEAASHVWIREPQPVPATP